MRKVVKRKVNKRNTFGIAMVVLLVLSTLGFAFVSRLSGSSSSIESKSYAGLTFVREGDYWVTDIGKNKFYFSYFPSDLNVSVDVSAKLEDYAKEEVYFVNSVIDEKSLKAKQEFLINLNGYILRAQDACLEGTFCERDIPEKNCSDNLIVFVDNSLNESGVWQEDKCVYFSGDYVEGMDGFLYRIFGIR